MLSVEIQSVVNELLALLRQFPRSEYGLAVGGAHAKGTADEGSDLDLYLFAPRVLTNDERTQAASRFSPQIRELVSWGTDPPFVQGGTDFYYRQVKVECWLRNSEHIARTIAECRAGVVTREFVRWTTTGFYNHCCLSDLKWMIPVEDPSGLLARWQVEIGVYPPKLRDAIVRTHLSGARFWPSNFHYSSAVERQDVIYTTGIVQQVVHHLIQVVFAVNEVYFPGDKKLEAALGHLDRLPDRFVERIRGLIWPDGQASAQMLAKQQASLQHLLRDTEALVTEQLGR